MGGMSSLCRRPGKRPGADKRETAGHVLVAECSTQNSLNHSQPCQEKPDNLRLGRRLRCLRPQINVPLRESFTARREQLRPSREMSFLRIANLAANRQHARLRVQQATAQPAE